MDGQPIVQIADRQTTGGQPKIDFVASLGRPLLAQIAPGDGVRFEVVALGQEACDWVVVQVGALAGVAASQGGRLSHANAHDALYNRAAKDARLARGIARAVDRIGEQLCPVRFVQATGFRAKRHRAAPQSLLRFHGCAGSIGRPSPPAPAGFSGRLRWAPRAS